MEKKLYQIVEHMKGHPSYEMVKIYKVRLWVLKEKRGGGFESVPMENMERVIIDNYDRAESLYKEYQSTYRGWTGVSSKYRGFVEFYEAFVYDNGEISSYPHGEKYIKRETTEN